MGFSDWFTFRNPEETARRAKEYREKMLPLGDAQKEAVLTVLRQRIGGKFGEDELLFFFLCAKEKYLDETALPEIRRFLKKRGKLNEDEIEGMLSLVILDCRAESLEAYPGIEEVKTFRAPEE